MKAAYIESYGSASKVKIGEQPKPKAARGCVLIKMKAASVNPIDWKTVKGDLKPLVKPPFPILLGNDGAGIIEELGKGVTGLGVGDEVYFRCRKADTGTYAEYFSIPVDLVAKKPSNMSFEEAASIPLVGLTVLQALKEKGGMKPDSKVLIHAGAGGVGTFAIQFAKACGAFVAATASAKRIDLLNDLGADVIIDYHTQKIEDELSDFDIVLDTLGDDVQEASYQVLKPGGVLVSIQGIPDVETMKYYGAGLMVRLVGALSNRKKQKQAAKHGVRYDYLFMKENGAQLAEIAELIEVGKIKAVIDSTYPLDQVQQAFERSMTGRSQGKIIISID